MKKQLVFISLVFILGIILSGAVSAADDSSEGTNVLNTTDPVHNPSHEDTSTSNKVISGTVTRCSNGEPFAGVKIKVNSMDNQLLASTVTDNNGKYKLSFVDSDTVFKVTASSPGHISSTRKVTLTNNPSDPSDPKFYGTANFRL